MSSSGHEIRSGFACSRSHGDVEVKAEPTNRPGVARAGVMTGNVVNRAWDRARPIFHGAGTSLRGRYFGGIAGHLINQRTPGLGGEDLPLLERRGGIAPPSPSHLPLVDEGFWVPNRFKTVPKHFESEVKVRDVEDDVGRQTTKPRSHNATRRARSARLSAVTHRMIPPPITTVSTRSGSAAPPWTGSARLEAFESRAPPSRPDYIPSNRPGGPLSPDLEDLSSARREASSRQILMRQIRQLGSLSVHRAMLSEGAAASRPCCRSFPGTVHEDRVEWARAQRPTPVAVTACGDTHGLRFSSWSVNGHPPVDLHTRARPQQG